jgi:hypothetical protein
MSSGESDVATEPYQRRLPEAFMEQVCRSWPFTMVVPCNAATPVAADGAEATAISLAGDFQGKAVYFAPPHHFPKDSVQRALPQRRAASAPSEGMPKPLPLHYPQPSASATCLSIVFHRGEMHWGYRAQHCCERSLNHQNLTLPLLLPEP